MGTFAAFEKLVPVALAFGCGVLFARRGLIGAATSKAFADFAFLLAVPCYLFGNLYRSDLGALFAWRALAGYAIAAVAGMAVISVVAWLSTTREPRQIALRIMAGIQVNTAYFAVPVFIMLFGDASPIFPVLLFQVCVLTTVVLAIMELGGARVVPAAVGASASAPRQAPRPAGRVTRALWGSLTTPLVLACNAGLLINLLSVRLPGPLLDGFSFVGSAASPVALFALGLHLGGAGLNIRGTTLEEVWLIVVKCLAFPLAVWLVCEYVLGIHGEWLRYLVLIAAMPAPQNLFLFAQRYDVGVDMSAALVVKSSVAALLLLPLWIRWAQAV
jgi:malonate transporter